MGLIQLFGMILQYGSEISKIVNSITDEMSVTFDAAVAGGMTNPLPPLPPKKPDKDKKPIHKDVNGRSGVVPPTSTPNASQDLYVDGKLWQRRFYGEDGRMIRDVDF